MLHVVVRSIIVYVNGGIPSQIPIKAFVLILHILFL